MLKVEASRNKMEEAEWSWIAMTVGCLSLSRRCVRIECRNFEFSVERWIARILLAIWDASSRLWLTGVQNSACNLWYPVCLNYNTLSICKFATNKYGLTFLESRYCGSESVWASSQKSKLAAFRRGRMDLQVYQYYLWLGLVRHGS